MKQIGVLAVAVALVPLVGIWSAADAQMRNLAMGSTQTSSSHYSYFVGAAKAINLLVPELNVTVVETGATVENIKRMQKGQLDMGLVTADQVYLAWRGQETWKDAPFEGIRQLWLYSVSANYVTVREETGIKSIHELTSKKFTPGIRGSAVEKGTETVFGILGIKPDWQRMGTADTVDAMKDKRIVGFAKSGSGFFLDASTMDIATRTALRTLPFSEEDVKKVRAVRPYLPWIKVPAGSIKDQGEFWTTASLAFVAGTKSMPADVAYKVVKAIWEGQEHQPQAVMGAAHRNPRGTIEHALSPLHAGAIRFYRELGLKIPDELIPPEAK
ncbi:MAG: TAXI family TRAP transporter solute-binding subunit [Candidatus Rokubacteria bacterium]|nr:TAXI family TRAP transporter solute-binding subunit [Candidatus Rokubacteria bacterium]